METTVRAELLGLLGLSACSLEVGIPDGMPTLGRGGALATKISVYHDGGFELPSGGVGIPVLQVGHTVGYLVCTPAPGVAVSAARRRTAVTLADLLGLSYSANPSARPAHRN